VKIYDISPPLTPSIAVWPGDVPFSREVACAIADGSNIDLSSVRTTVHVGAHTDAPSHYAATGASIADRPLDRYVGTCQVVTVTVGRGGRIRPSDVPMPLAAPRILFRTGTYPDPNAWNGDFAALSAQLVDMCADHGVVLVGIDTPSIDPADDKALESHTAVFRRDLAILEGIVLDDVADGLYTLVALPLRIPGADASPVRAVLIDGRFVESGDAGALSG
jgi:arylformamidase